jgi:hypothetical protein
MSRALAPRTGSPLMELMQDSAMSAIKTTAADADSQAPAVGCCASTRAIIHTAAAAAMAAKPHATRECLSFCV